MTKKAILLAAVVFGVGLLRAPLPTTRNYVSTLWAAPDEVGYGIGTMAGKMPISSVVVVPVWSYKEAGLSTQSAQADTQATASASPASQGASFMTFMHEGGEATGDFFYREPALFSDPDVLYPLDRLLRRLGIENPEKDRDHGDGVLRQLPPFVLALSIGACLKEWDQVGDLEYCREATQVFFIPASCFSYQEMVRRTKWKAVCIEKGASTTPQAVRDSFHKMLFKSLQLTWPCAVGGLAACSKEATLVPDWYFVNSPKVMQAMQVHAEKRARRKSQNLPPKEIDL